ncbi:MAG: ABC transporter substrate-binding protein, partial [Pseudomonadota bacterium]
MKMFKTKLLSIAAATALLASGALAENVVTVNAVQIFGTIDPAKINDYTEYMAGVNLYEALTTLDGSGTIQPLLAESWTTSEDGLTWTFTLKEGATFQDGSPIEAKDVVWSVNRLLAINEGPSYLFEDVLEEGSVTEV